MVADVPADGFSVELERMGPTDSRGHIVATGQMCRFLTAALSGAIQSFLLNGPSTNDPDCKTSGNGCWWVGFWLVYIVVVSRFRWN